MRAVWDALISWLNQNSGAAQAMLTAGLVLFAAWQGILAWSARNNAKRLAAAARVQADASVRMAEEMRITRLFAAEPIVVPRQRGSTTTSVEVELANTGRGPAYNIECVIKHPAFVDPGKTMRSLYLEPGRKEGPQTIYADPGAPEYHGAPLEVRYEDQYGKVKYSRWRDGTLEMWREREEGVRADDS